MPVVRRPAILKAVYDETVKKIRSWEVPNEMIFPTRTLYRASEAQRFILRSDGVIDKKSANQVLIVRDQNADRNRFSGIPCNTGISAWGGLYCSLQHSALVNELLHYAGPEIPRNKQTGLPRADQTLECKCVVKIRLMGSVLAADLSPHNPGARKFVEDLGRCPTVQSAFHSTGNLAVTIWSDLFDGEDCSVARGIGLAVANSGIFHALQALSVRSSGRPGGETGDNVVFFAHDNQSPPGLWIEEAYLFPVNAKPQVYPVEF